MTFATKAELSTRVLGSERLARGRANCSIKTSRMEFDIFDGIGEAWIRYSSQLRVRGGFGAIDPRACALHPAACAAVQRVLKKDPTLMYVNGRFVPAHELTPPLPPPPPTPPPLFDLYQTPPPPPYPPVPRPPPPWYAHAETCVPITTAAENDIEVADGLERSVCVYVRSIQDERVRATRCFTALSPSPPPPPPAPQSRLASIAAAALQRRVRHGGTNGAEGALDIDSLEQYTKEAEAKQKEQLAYLEQLSDSNFQLREVLGGIIDRVEGRRLWQRTEFHQSHRLEDNILATTAFGNAPVAGVTLEECQVLCAAIDNATVGTCQAVAYARLNADPLDYTLRQCYLLKHIGGCSSGSFAGALFARRDTDGCTAPTDHDNPLCVQLAPSRRDMVCKCFT